MINETDYGRALFELAQEEGKDDIVLEETRAVAKLFRENPEYVKLLDSPAMAAEARIDLVGQAFGDLSLYHLNFLKILCQKHSVRQYVGCAETVEKLYDEAHGILRAEAVTAVPMSGKQRDALQRKLCNLTGKTVLVHNRVDPGIMGGVQLRMGGTQLDNSIQTRLDDLRRALSAAIV